MSDVVWHLVSMGATTVKLVFIFGGIFLFTARTRDKEPPRVLRLAFRWAKRAFPTGAVLYWVSQVVLYGPLDGWDAVLIGLDWWNYRGLKDEDDDDYWKRQQEKVTGVVKSLGHRLVVAPATG